MAGELRPFDPNRVTVSWSIGGGATLDLTEGLINGPTAIQEAKDAALWNRTSDRQSNTTRNRETNKGATVALTYVASAEIHDVLSAIALADGVTGASVGPLVIKDLQGTTLMTYLAAFIQDDPVVQYGDTAADRTWLFGCAMRVPFVGGASPL